MPSPPIKTSSIKPIETHDEPEPQASIDVTFTFDTNVTPTLLQECLQYASEHQLKGIMGYSTDPLVSSDFIHQSESLIIDSLQIMQIGQQYKVFAWYDNEWGYVNRLVDMCLHLAHLKR